MPQTVLPNMTDLEKVHRAIKYVMREEFPTILITFNLVEDGGTFTLTVLETDLVLTSDDLVEEDGDALYFTPIKAFMLSLYS